MRRTVQVIAIAAAVAASVSASAPAVVLDRPVPAEVYVKSAGKATPLRGSLVQYDDQTFTLSVGTDRRILSWTDVTPATAFALRQKVVDRTKADQWLALGTFGWSIGVKDQAQNALKTAVRLDPSLKTKADTVLTRPAGTLGNAATRPATRELIENGGNPSAPALPPAEVAKGAAEPSIKFKPATPDEIAEAMKRNRKQADGVQAKIGVTLREFETPHFLVFTDWDPREYDFLKTNLEGAYEVVARQFNMSPKDNVFVGKLPVYMLVRYRDFESFAVEIDDFNGVNDRTAGYYTGKSNGIGHMAMWKPNQSMTGTDNLDDARRLWAYVLVHEFTHAFLARYKSNEFVPRWLNEGIAEVIAYSEFPYGGRRRMARMIAGSGADVGFLFNDANRPTGEYYPVMQSMVELLVSINKQNFLKLIDSIKDGKKPEAALKELYHVDYDQFAQGWRDWARKRTDD